MTNRLRAVAEDERITPKQAKTILAAADTGTRRDLLVATRKRLASACDDPNTPARDLAALTRRLLEVSKEIEAIDVRTKEADDEAAVTEDDAWEAV